MKQVTNFPLYNGCLEEFGNMAGVVRDYCEACGLDGLEVIWDYKPYTEELPPPGRAVGYHLLFWSYWVEFWNRDEQALVGEFGSADFIEEYFHGLTREDMVRQYKVDLQRAIDLQAEYVVFHVSEVAMAECFT